MQIVDAARSWIGTPFHHQGRIKTVGVDCLRLLIGVALELYLRDVEGVPLAAYDELSYGHMPDERNLYMKLQNVLIETKALKSENIVLFEIDGAARHLGIIGSKNGYFSIIHAYAPARKVIEHRLDEEWKAKIVKLFKVAAT